ncbi:MAG TPA: polymer-forming cytoskeletal protein, partial [Candidatus Binatia bacterium]|nr:polymer-forming cytoskeletal protein [Candidatus Binatia bacterium]
KPEVRPEVRPEPKPEQVAPVSVAAPRKESSLKDRRESVFGVGVSIEGKIEGDANVRIAGNFKGDIQIKGDLNIEKGAHLNGKINAETVTIEGELEGNVVASHQVRLLESGQLIGDLKAATLTVAAGSRMRGNVEFGWNDSDAAKFANGRAHESSKTVSAGREQAGVAREL